MKKVGFIDYYLDQWHANNYPEMLKKASNGKYEVAYAYGKIDSPLKGGLTNKAWAEKNGVALLDTIEEVIEKSDVLIVMSPDNPEMHEQLCDLPLKSGKLTYIDKTFAPDKETALRIFANAEAHSTPCFSSSALYFSTELNDMDTDKITKLYSRGPGAYDIYSIHQIEPILKLMKTDPKRVMFLGDKQHPSMVIEFTDGRYAQMYQGTWIDFEITTADEKNNMQIHPIRSDYFMRFIESLIAFFDTGIAPVTHRQTVNVIATINAGHKAAQTPFEWVEV
ncbi:MAG: hypothetical protein IJD83_06435 [Clostridia bacterium]|nr:hypothetical protein [Clostridia bacterium]